ncbi:hypothetical protein ACJ41O_012078 [Fusarium nematophilum]
MSGPEDLKIPSSRQPAESIAISVFETDNASSHPPPVIVMGHGIGGVRRSALPVFAKAFNKAGYHAVTLDYLQWGDSDGGPRSILSVKGQLQDFRDVIAWVRQCPDRFDHRRLVVWGTSFGGMHVTALLAEDHDIAAGIAQCPCVDGLAASKLTPLARSLRLGWEALRDCWSQCTRGQPIYVELLNDGSTGSMTSIMVEEEAVEIWKALLPEDGSPYANAIGAYSLLEIPKSRPVLQAHKISKPYLIVLPTTDAEAPLEAAEEVVLRAPLGEALRVDGGHFDLYPRMQSYQKNLAGQLAFLERVLS